MWYEDDASSRVSRVTPSCGVFIEGSVSVALAFVLGFIKIWRLPQGGEISLEMVPIITFSLFRGFIPGTLAGMTFGLLNCMQFPVVVHPVQFILDYPCAFGALGLAGIFSRERTIYPLVWLYVFVSILGRFFFHVLSGVLFIEFFIRNAPVNSLIYSAVYNASYLVPDFIICAPCVQLLFWKLKKIIR